jgi:pyruvate-formate lyase-activating enzyme
MCFVRGPAWDQIVLTSYGHSSGFCVDPVEKKPLNHFLPGSAVLSFGTAGCNLACKFCQNWDISKSREIDTLADSATPHTRCVTSGTRPTCGSGREHGTMRGGSDEPGRMRRWRHELRCYRRQRVLPTTAVSRPP